MQFDKHAGEYDKHAHIQRDIIDWALPSFPQNLEGKNVLEMGAGTGLLTKFLINKKPRLLTTTDISPTMLAVGKKQLPQAHWQPMDAWRPTLSGYDAIFSANLLQWAPQPEQTLKRWTSCLNPNATIHCTFFIDQTLKELRSLDPKTSPIHWHTRTQWESFFRNAGFTTTHSQDLIKPYYSPNALTLFKTLHHLGATTTTRLTPTKLRALLKSYDQHFRSGKSIHSTWHFFQVNATLKPESL